MTKDDILNILETDIESLRKEYDDCSIKIKANNSDITENSAFHSLESKMTDIRSQIDTRSMCQYYIMNIEPILKDRVCMASMISCDFNGKNVILVVAPWSITEFSDKGFIFLNSESKLGGKLLGKKNGDSVSEGEYSIAGINILK